MTKLTTAIILVIGSMIASSTSDTTTTTKTETWKDIMGEQYNVDPYPYPPDPSLSEW